MTTEKTIGTANHSNAGPIALADEELKAIGGGMATREMQEMNMSFNLHENPGKRIRFPAVTDS